MSGDERKKTVNGKLDCAVCDTRGTGPFRDLEPADCTRLSERKVHNVYARGQTLYYEGNRPTGVFCVKQGRVKCYRLGPTGQRQITRIAEAGDILGFSSVMRGKHCTETAEAIEESVVCFIPKENFLSAVTDHRVLLDRLFATLLGEKESLERLVVSLATLTVRERTLRLLNYLTEHYSTDRSPDGTVWLDVPLTRQEMSEMIGTSVETFIRILADLKDSGLVANRGRMLGIRDAKRLADLASSAAA